VIDPGISATRAAMSDHVRTRRFIGGERTKMYHPGRGRISELAQSISACRGPSLGAANADRGRLSKEVARDLSRWTG
jgi:hypothetical protein